MAATDEIHERDVDSELCGRCGACCRITIKLPDTDTRYRSFLRQTGFRLLPPPKPGALDCCNQRHDATLDMGYCSHLEVKEGAEGLRFRCRVYATSAFPQLCEQYNCVSWAKVGGQFPLGSENVDAARAALRELHKERQQRSLGDELAASEATREA